MASVSAQSNVTFKIEDLLNSGLQTWSKVLRSLARAAKRSKQVSAAELLPECLQDQLADDVRLAEDDEVIGLDHAKIVYVP